MFGQANGGPRDPEARAVICADSEYSFCAAPRRRPPWQALQEPWRPLAAADRYPSALDPCLLGRGGDLRVERRIHDALGERSCHVLVDFDNRRPPADAPRLLNFHDFLDSRENKVDDDRSDDNRSDNDDDKHDNHDNDDHAAAYDDPGKPGSRRS